MLREQPLFHIPSKMHTRLSPACRCEEHDGRQSEQAACSSRTGWEEASGAVVSSPTTPVRDRHTVWTSTSHGGGSHSLAQSQPPARPPARSLARERKREPGNFSSSRHPGGRWLATGNPGWLFPLRVGRWQLSRLKWLVWPGWGSRSGSAGFCLAPVSPPSRRARRLPAAAACNKEQAAWRRRAGRRGGEPGGGADGRTGAQLWGWEGDPPAEGPAREARKERRPVSPRGFTLPAFWNAHTRIESGFQVPIPAGSHAPPEALRAFRKASWES